MTDSNEPTFVIVGASLAGAKAAETLRSAGHRGRVLLIGEEIDPPYERPPLSKGYLLGTQERDAAFVHEPSWYAEHDVELLLGRRVTGLDRDRHEVLVDGVDRVGYDKLLLATGCRVRPLPVPGMGLAGVRQLRTLAEAEELLPALRPGTQVVIIGSGWIGLEVAAAARQRDCRVTVVGRGALPLRRVLGDELGAVYRDLHAAHGVEFRFDVEVTEFGSLDERRLSHVVLDDRTELPADLVLVAVGVRPNVELAEAAGLPVDDGVVTDAALRTADPDVYACGDVAAFHHPLLDARIRVEHWANALHGGPAAARSMLGQQVSHDPLPYFFSDQYDLGMEYAGWVPPDGYDRVVFRGDPTVRPGGAPEFLAFWVRDGRVLAGMNANVWDVQDDIQVLVRAGWAGHRVDLDRLADPGTPLAKLAG
ncbi:NAD(P)/FAD-dependent oxidoreductase [Micromonospora zhanjiangensis]|uniref:NAD(P)/FAD-dependent oxidoreductase n=1 Tax=Micromonospora zhanjiangensis TaxID=1522057 RepID=A0ABV8KQM9_9ACTN